MSTPTPVGDPVFVAFSKGFDRAAQAGIQANAEESGSILDELRSFLEHSAPVTERGARLFAEAVGIAAAARQHYGEPPLEVEQISSYFQHSAEFFNSFFCP